MSVKDNAGSRIKMRWPLLLLLVSIAATAIVAFEAQRQMRSHRRTSVGLLRDYTSIASWNYQRYASEALRDGVVAVLGPVMHFQLHGQLHQGPPALVTWFTDHYHDRQSPHYGDEGPIPELLPATYFGFSIGADTLAVAGQPMPGGAASALTDTLSAHIRNVYQTNWGVGLITVGEVTVAYTIMPTTLGDTAVYGFAFEPATFAPLFRRVFERAELLPATLMEGRANPEVLDVAIVAPGGRMLFESARRAHQPFHGNAEMAPQFGGLAVTTTLERATADQLIIGGLPRSRLPFLLALLGIAAALALVAVGQLRREGQLARQRSDFVSSVSHELRTPLAQIRLFLETLRLRRYESAAQSEWMLDNIDRETSRLANLVENLLLFTRLDHGRPRGVPEPVELAAEIRQIIDAFEPLAASRRVRLHASLQDGIIAQLQRGPFRQVLLNLLDNAVKYGPTGQTVKVVLQSSSGRARIAIEDMGPGVSREERSAIWKPFRRGVRAGETGQAGGGIGLSIVAEVVAHHGGTVWVEDAPGGGAAFIVELPCFVRAPSEPAPAAF